MLSMALLFDSTFLSQAFLYWSLNAAIVVLLIGPLVWISNRSKPRKNVKHTLSLLGFVAMLTLVHICLLLAPRFGVFESLDWNWLGKWLSIVFVVSLISLWPRLSWQSIGVVTPKKGTWLRVIIILAGTSMFWILAGSENAPTNLDLETLLFQATMPGLEEELFFRGILWVLLAQALPGVKRLGKTEISWSLVITTLYFALGHGFTFNSDLSLVFDPVILIYSGIVGFTIGWIRVYSGSIIPAIILHNGINLLAVVIPSFV